MNESGILKVSDEVRASFEPIMKALERVRQELSAVKDVVTVRPRLCLSGSRKSRAGAGRRGDAGYDARQRVPAAREIRRGVRRDRSHGRGAAGGEARASGLVRLAGGPHGFDV